MLNIKPPKQIAISNVVNKLYSHWLAHQTASPLTYLYNTSDKHIEIILNV